MSVLFTIPPKYRKYKKPVSIYVRLSETKEFQLFSSTGFKIHPRYWNFEPNSKELLKKNFKPVPRTKKEIENKVKVLSNTVLDKLKTHITERFEVARFNRDRYPNIDSKWLKEVIQDFRSETIRKDFDLFVNFFEVYIKREDKPLCKPILKRVQEFQKKPYYISDINSDFSKSYGKWLLGKNYTPGYVNQELTHIKRVLKNAKKLKYISDVDFEDWVKFKDKEKEKLGVVYLDNKELDKVFNCDVSYSKKLDNIKTIFLVSSYTGLRFSDVHKVKIEDVKNGRTEISIKKKGNKKLTVPILPRVRDLLMEKKPIKKISNGHFNDNLTELMRLAKIDNVITHRKRKREKGGTHRAVVTITAPKYEFITSHVGRRSFCSNYYGKIPTPTLMAISGHTTESSFLRYIGKTSDDAVDVFLDMFNN